MKVADKRKSLRLAPLLFFSVVFLYAPAGSTQGQNPGRQDQPQPQPEMPDRSVVYIHAVNRHVLTDQPFGLPAVEEKTGSAFVLKNKYIVTDIELVRYAVSLEIRKYPQGPSFPGRVVVLGYDCGLAFVTVDNPAFFSDIPGLDLSDVMPGPGAIVQVIGFEGNTARPLVLNYPVINSDFSFIENSDADRRRIFNIQPNTAVPSLLTGGPVIFQGKIVGLFHTKEKTYVIHSSVVLHMMEDHADGRYDGFPSAAFTFSPVENPYLQSYFGMTAAGIQGGILVDRVGPFENMRGVLQAGDIIFRIGTYSFNSTGQVVVGTENVEFLDYLNRLQSDRVWVSILRRGKPLEKEQTLPLNTDAAFSWKRKSIFQNRKYFMSAGLAFQELDYDVMHDTRAGSLLGNQYRYGYYIQDSPSDTPDRYVVLTSRLEDPINSGSEIYIGGTVQSINGRRVRDLAEFAREWKAAQTRYIVLHFYDQPLPLVIDNQGLAEKDAALEKKFSLQENGRVR